MKLFNSSEYNSSGNFSKQNTIECLFFLVWRPFAIRTKKYFAEINLVSSVGILLLSFYTSDLNAQTKDQLNGSFQVFQINTGGSSEYILIGSFLNIDDKYSASEIRINDCVIDSKGDLYIIKTVNSTSGSVSVDVEDPRIENTSPDFGKGIIFRPTTRNRYPLMTNASPEALKSTVFNTLSIRLDEIESTVGLTGAVMKTDYTANTMLLATTNATPEAATANEIKTFLGISTSESATTTFEYFEMDGDFAAGAGTVVLSSTALTETPADVTASLNGSQLKPGQYAISGTTVTLNIPVFQYDQVLITYNK